MPIEKLTAGSAEPDDYVKIPKETPSAPVVNKSTLSDKDCKIQYLPQYMNEENRKKLYRNTLVGSGIFTHPYQEMYDSRIEKKGTPKTLEELLEELSLLKEALKANKAKSWWRKQLPSTYKLNIKLKKLSEEVKEAKTRERERPRGVFERHQTENGVLVKDWYREDGILAQRLLPNGVLEEYNKQGELISRFDENEIPPLEKSETKPKFFSSVSTINLEPTSGTTGALTEEEERELRELEARERI